MVCVAVRNAYLPTAAVCSVELKSPREDTTILLVRKIEGVRSLRKHSSSPTVNMFGRIASRTRFPGECDTNTASC